MRTRSADRSWEPFLGACSRPDGVRFRVWAPEAKSVEVAFERGGAAALAREARGYFSALVAQASPGDLYRYRVDGRGPFPDPASRFQPRGVHGPSEIIAPASYRWNDDGWPGAIEPLSFYELHVGTFTPQGTFLSAIEKLPLIAELGVRAIELMPVADFPGTRNWGYDGAALFAPARCYGRPDDLRALVDAAHALGLGVFLDVVYNHLGPDGNYTGAFSPYYFTEKHRSPWGRGVNLDQRRSREARRFFVENANHWIHEYHVDGLRLDATHAMVDESPRHFLAELAENAREHPRGGRRPILVAEDDRNLAKIVTPARAGGWGLDAVWADDFHHQTRRLLAGDRDGYFRDYGGGVEDLAVILSRNWLYEGQTSPRAGRPRGTPAAGLPPERFVFCLQNHDQIGNRALGERLNHQIDAAAYRAACVLLLAAPQTPLLFMGQEWGASTPFLYFTDHEPELGRAVTEGRRKEFKEFSDFRDPARREKIPDPQSAETFRRSRLNWDERGEPERAALLRLHQALLRLRKALRPSPVAPWARAFADKSGLALRREADDRVLLILAAPLGASRVDLRALEVPNAGSSWRVELTTEDPLFCPRPLPVEYRFDAGRASLEFRRAGAAVLAQER